MMFSKTFPFLLIIGMLSIDLFSLPSSFPFSPPENFQEGEKYNILQYSANIRTGPSVNNDIIAILNLNDEIEIVEKTEIRETINNAWEYWYKIKFGSIIGYTFGGNIAIKTLVTDIDKNGINDYFYFRNTTKIILSDDISFTNIDSHNDIIIYINNQRINTNMLYRYWLNTHSPESFLQEMDDHDFYWCEFMEEGDHVYILLHDFARDYLWSTIYRINGEGRIEFYEWTEGIVDYDYDDDKYYTRVVLRVRLSNDGKMEFIGRFGDIGE
jgi:hypothetical protein